MLSSGSAAAEHLTNPAEGKRPREMPTESRQSIKTMDLVVWGFEYHSSSRARQAAIASEREPVEPSHTVYGVK